MLFSIFLLIIISTTINGLYQGDSCKDENVNGTCVNIYECLYALKLVKKGLRPTHCGFDGIVPIVCCPDSKPLEELRVLPGTISNLFCEKITSFPFGVQFVTGGMKTKPRKFIHMALIGFGDIDNPQWHCGGSLINEEYILTAAHCTSKRDLGKAKIVRLGDLNWNSTDDDAAPQNYPVLKIIVHPEYKPPMKYNDIALLQILKLTEFTIYTRPACLWTKEFDPSLTPIATGWGKTNYAGPYSNHLMEVPFQIRDLNNCRSHFDEPGKRDLPNGLLGDRQFCAGDEGKDTCQGDSGGPLQYSFRKKRLYYSIIGVTSFGKSCGIGNVYGIYTKVSFYIEWIESVLWPNGPNFPDFASF